MFLAIPLLISLKNFQFFYYVVSALPLLVFFFFRFANPDAAIPLLIFSFLFTRTPRFLFNFLPSYLTCCGDSSSVLIFYLPGRHDSSSTLFLTCPHYFSTSIFSFSIFFYPCAAIPLIHFRFVFNLPRRFLFFFIWILHLTLTAQWLRARNWWIRQGAHLCRSLGSNVHHGRLNVV